MAKIRRNNPLTIAVSDLVVHLAMVHEGSDMDVNDAKDQLDVAWSISYLGAVRKEVERQLSVMYMSVQTIDAIMNDFDKLTKS